MEDRRELERFKIRIPGKISLPSDTGARQKRVMSLLTRDVSAGGAFFDNDGRNLPIGAHVEIDLILDVGSLKRLGGRRAIITINGEVLRSEPGGVAIRFGKGYKIVPLPEGEP